MPNHIKTGERAPLTNQVFHTERFQNVTTSFDLWPDATIYYDDPDSDHGTKTDSFYNSRQLVMVFPVKCLVLSHIDQCPSNVRSIANPFYDVSDEAGVVMDRSTGDYYISFHILASLQLWNLFH